MAIALLVGSLAPGSADAAGFGQTAVWGTPGNAPGTFQNPRLLGVDSTTGSVYVGDLLGPRIAQATTLRVQKFSPAGRLEGTAEIPKSDEEPADGFQGILVDDSRGLIYLLEIEEEAKVATQVLAFSTTPDPITGELPPASTATLPLPTGSEALGSPEALALDPSTGDILILAHEVGTGVAVVERIAPSGTFVDREALPGQPEFMTVGPDGTIYFVEQKGNSANEDALAFELSPQFTDYHEVPGFKAAEERDGPAGGHVVGSFPGEGSGPQIAVSPDGSTLYLKYADIRANSPSERSPILIRGYSFADESMTHRYGSLDPEPPPAGTEAFNEKCVVSSFPAALATKGESVVVLDQGPELRESAIEEFPANEPKFGYRVETFGPGGSCTGAVGQPPQALFELKLGTQHISSAPVNSAVTFDPRSTELPEAGTKVSELSWRIQGPSGTETIPAVHLNPEVEAASALPTLEHTFPTPGTYTVRLTLTGATAKAPERYGLSWGAPAQTLQVVPSPSVTALNPTHGPAAGGNQVEITGTELAGATKVEFGTGNSVTTFAEDTATKIKLTAPPGTAGQTVDVTVTTAAATSATASADRYTYDAPTPTVTGIAPTHGAPGTEVTITGTGLTGATAVSFGSEAAASFTVESGTTIKAHSPIACITGTVDVTVTTAGGTSATGAGDSFTCEAPVTPSVTALNPTHGPAAGGNQVEITGTELAGATKVEFGTGNSVTTFAEDTATKIKLTAPPGTAGQTVDVTVTTVAGTSATGSADSYAYDTAPPTVSKFTLTASNAGTGSGTVTSSPAGISCGSTCSASFNEGTTVALTASASSGSTFAGWGGACSGTGICVVAVNAATTVTATFNANPPAEVPKTELPKTELPKTKPTKTKSQILAAQRKAALKKCQKLKGHAKAMCVKKANQIGKPKKAKSKKKGHAGKGSSRDLLIHAVNGWGLTSRF